MLTLKVITTDQDGQIETVLFSGDSIAHKEYFSQDHSFQRKVVEKNDTLWCIGNMIETSSEQKFVVSDVVIYDEDRSLKHVLLILPKADCYIMENGKTIDSFFCTYDLDYRPEIKNQ